MNRDHDDYFYRREDRTKERLWSAAIGVFAALCGSIFSFYLGRLDQEKGAAARTVGPGGVHDSTVIIHQQIEPASSSSPLEHFFSFGDSFVHVFFGVLAIVLFIAFILLLLQIFEWIDLLHW